MDPLRIIGRLGTDNPPTDDELHAAENELLEALNIATSEDTLDLEFAQDLRNGLDKVREEKSTRDESREEQRRKAAELREGVFEETEESNEDSADETTEAGETTEGTEANEQHQEEPVPASPSASDLVTRLQAHAARLPKPEEAKPKSPGVSLKPVGPAAGYEMDGDEGFATLGHMFATHAKSITRDGNSTPLVRLTRHYNDERTLSSNVDLNNKKLSQAFGFGPRSTPVAAAGGLCGPGDVDHSHPICSDRGRPVRDALLQFNASRGRLQYAPAASASDLDANISIWTEQTDSDAVTSGETKPCPPVECPEELSESVDAVVKCLTVGNFQAQFSPEFWASRLELALVQHDREAERKAISEIHAASTDLADVAPTGGNVLSNFLTTVNEVIAADRQINRNLSGEYVVLTDAYVRAAIRNQFIVNNGTGNQLDAIQVADAQIAGWLGDVNARPVWTWDGTVDTEAGTHRAATPGNLPDEATVYIWPVEAFMFLDGGTLDLGTSITDSSLNATNDRQAFSESFEKVAFRGCSSYRVEIGLDTFCGCP